MKLYPKKLRSIDDLEQEKQILRKEIKQLDKEQFLSLDGLLGKKGSKGEDTGIDVLSTVLDFLPISNPVVSQVVKLAVGWFSKKEDVPKSGPWKEDTVKKPGKSLLQKAAIEFIGGYLKWKAIELSFKGIKYIIKKRKGS